MRLRSRLLLLIALLVSAALGASFWIIFRAVRSQTLADLDRSLQSAHRVWESLSRAQAQSLATTTSGMAAEAGFVQVLRQTDRATLLDYLRGAQQNNSALDLVAVYDEQGGLRVSTEPNLPAERSDVLIAAALQEQVGAAYWSCPAGFYMAAACPIYKQNSVEGVLLLATRLDGPFVESLAGDTNCQVALLPNHGTGFTTSMQMLGADQPEVHKHAYPLPDFAGSSLGSLVIGRDLDASLGYMRAVWGELSWLGAGVVGLAFLVSVPLVGRMTNPVLLLEKAQAEMDAIFQANADGLVALDQAGKVVSANPAACVCLGVALERLPGRLLQELLPEEVFTQLIAVPPSDGQLVQRCQWLREGRTFQLTRTFVASRHVEVGSVLVTREVSASQSPREPVELLQQLASPPETREQWLAFEKARLDLLWLSGFRAPSATATDPRAQLDALQWPGPVELVDPLPALDLQQDQWRLLLVNLWPCEKLILSQDGGGCWLHAQRTVPLGNWEREVLRTLMLELNGRFFEDEGQLRMWLPQAL